MAVPHLTASAAFDLPSSSSGNAWSWLRVRRYSDAALSSFSSIETHSKVSTRHTDSNFMRSPSHGIRSSVGKNRRVKDRLIKATSGDERVSPRRFQNNMVNITVMVAAATTLAISAAIAGIIPARRAASINPVDALRVE